MSGDLQKSIVPEMVLLHFRPNKGFRYNILFEAPLEKTEKKALLVGIRMRLIDSECVALLTSECRFETSDPTGWIEAYCRKRRRLPPSWYPVEWESSSPWLGRDASVVKQLCLLSERIKMVPFLFQLSDTFLRFQG
jgi:hypothetical protein